MFDANAAARKIGVPYFAQALIVNQEMKEFGISSGDVVLCENMIRSDCDRRIVTEARVWTKFDGKRLEMPHDKSCWLVFCGFPDGTEFFNPDTELQALSVMGGKWIEMPDDLKRGDYAE
ncbi:hypothetical protein [Vibrio sp. D431a]|uniref:hypothetical protein n=1 Tax=Vibrio sp. D431a TaxID=2837388 RepID=UPI002556BF2A|nr:hypothetical protein [Vibrio sp. D431a]MDK9789869.1 hypothetical protein [Vibrio sp. D431a]